MCYSASKGALNGLTLPMARDLGRYGIRVVSIAPGIFLTPLATLFSEAAVNKLKSETALKRGG